MHNSSTQFDVIVIGGGHAGCEAALAAARLGARTLLLTQNLDHVAQMSCNPCIGGVAKGHVVREIDALGGEMGINTDATAIQTRMLNRSRGAAVFSPRAQCDKTLYQKRMKLVLELQPNLSLHQAQAVRFLTKTGAGFFTEGNEGNKEEANPAQMPGVASRPGVPLPGQATQVSQPQAGMGEETREQQQDKADGWSGASEFGLTEVGCADAARPGNGTPGLPNSPSSGQRSQPHGHTVTPPHRHTASVCGIRTEFGEEFYAAAIVVTTGTFLNGKMHYGMETFPGGRAGDPGSYPLAESLRTDLALEIGRLKTGTPPRVLGRTINFAGMERQDSDPENVRFSFREPTPGLPVFGTPPPALPCYLTATTPATAEIVRRNLHRSPMYTGRIEGIGARYCPSFEDKVVRFPHHETHHIFLEPEGATTGEYYLNGISTSLPVDVQQEMVRSLPGLEQAVITRYAYAIEYDFVFPHQLDATLAVRRWPNLFLAGQINGTSGYEEAAAQGLVAGINAARLAAGKPPVVIRRDQGFIGVMIDDLITKEIIEPYRLFTSRSEFRLSLRQDNADRRLLPLGHEIGLISAAEFARHQAFETEIAAARTRLQSTSHAGQPMWELLRRPEIKLVNLPGGAEIAPRVAEQLELEAKYEGYIKRERKLAENFLQLEEWPVPGDFDYDRIHTLCTEARIKLKKRQPRTLAQAARIDGVTPAEIALLQVYLRRS